MKTFILLAVVLFSAACSNSDYRELEARTKKLENQMRELPVKRAESGGILLNTSDSSYSILDVKVGKLLFSCSRVEPYLEGYKVFAEIGNPTSATFSGINLEFAWGKGEEEKETGLVPVLYEKKISLPNEIRAGSWTAIEFILDPATVDDLKIVGISASVDKLLLKRP
jgi:hypothetical protein